jgi:uncharacterized protein YdaU (DUF1376 family)
VNYYPFHIGDYLSATRHLSWEEDAAYRRLLDTYYTTEKPLPADLRAVCRLVLATTESQREAVKVVLEEFFKLTAEGYVNTRADAEIAAMREKQQKQRDKANKRWHKPEPEHGNASAMPQQPANDAAASKSDADAMPPTPTPTPVVIHPHSPRKRGRVSEFPPGFDAFWTAYPRKQAKGAAIKAFARLRADDALQADILAAIRRQADSDDWKRGGGKWIPYPATWLNDRRWEDQLPGVDDPYGLRSAL